MDNPFVYGEVVPAAAFVNRVAELDRLVGDLAAGQKVFLISPRRYGKSSLIRQALAAMARRGALTVDVTVSSFSSYVAFLEGYARALVAAETRRDRARTWLREAIRSARAEVRYESRTPPLGALTVSFPGVRSERDVSRLAQEVFALPARLAEARRRKVVVALDEFQAIGGFNGGSVEHALRAAVQHQRDVGYVFAGSEPSLMERMLRPKRPFYKAGPVMRLEKIPADEFAAFIDTRFTRRASSPNPDSAPPSSSSPATCPTTSSGSRTRPGTRCDAAGGAARRSTICTRRCAGCWPSSRRCSRRLAAPDAGAARGPAGGRARGRPRAAVGRCPRRATASAVRRPSRRRSPRSCATIRDRPRSRPYVVVDSLLREWVARQTY